MKKSQLVASIALLLLLLAINPVAGIFTVGRNHLGGLPWYGWFGLSFFVLIVTLTLALRDAVRSARLLERAEREKKIARVPRRLNSEELGELGIKQYHGPQYPHPVIFPERCIGCHACVDACPHDVLAMVDGRAAVVAREQCMEDTSCQVECPVNPKACIVVNTTKTIRPRPAPARDGSTYMTNVPGCYLIGDVSGVPLIKNAIKEGAEVIEHIASELKQSAPETKADYDVAIIGIGPGGASAALAAHERGLRYVGIEQETILATLEAYPAGKYIFFKPEDKDWLGGLGVLGLGLQTEEEGDAETFKRTLSPEMQKHWDEQLDILRTAIEQQLPAAMRAELASELEEKLVEDLRIQFTLSLLPHLTELERAMLMEDQLPQFFDEKILSLPAESLREFFVSAGREILYNLTRKIAGDQRERVLDLWLGTMREKGVRINEAESCKTVKRADDGDYFTVTTERLA
ncbi:MAG: 4Fe-4S binding protein, partial [Pyrinomonadaceae bacterium]|nr:4Fe-4S binding protein [Pyrinomonadaceae bacterium]